jgi:ATP-binding cassette, subfamily B, bacterial
MSRRAGSASSDKRLPRFGLLELRRLASGHLWALPPIILLGVLASFAEGLSISLVVLFLYTAMGRSDEAAAVGGPLGKFFTHLANYFPNPTLLAFLVLVMIALKAAFSTGYVMLTSFVQNRLGESIRDEIHRRYLDVEYGYIRQRDEGEMLNVLATESWSVSAAYQSLCRIAISATYTLVLTCFLLVISWQITVLGVLGAGLLFLTLNLLGRPARRLGEQARDVNQEMAARMLHTLQGMRAIRAFGQEEDHQHVFEVTSSEARRISTKTAFLMALVAPASEIGYVLLLVAIAVLSAALSLSFAATLAAVALLYRLQGPLRDMQNSLLALAQEEAPLRAVAEVLRQTKRPPPSKGLRPFSQLRQSIEFRNVSFRYDEDTSKVLESVSFSIPAGRTTALVGRSGAGKTTIVNLLLRLEEPEAGEILIDGTPLRLISRGDWLRNLAVAGQDIELMQSTVSANIRVARADATDEELREVARLAGVLADIDALPDGMDHWIGPQAANFSGGQRQRLGLARAFLRDPGILILDEATAALDVGLEQNIRTTLATRYQGRTIVIITHRLSTVANADHIICLEDGRIVEEGAPRKLLAQPAGTFRRLLFQMQVHEPANDRSEDRREHSEARAEY